MRSRASPRGGKDRAAYCCAWWAARARRATWRLAVFACRIPLLAARRSKLSAARIAAVVASASPASMARRAFRTAPRSRLRWWRFLARRFTDCRARFNADLWFATLASREAAE